MTTTNYAVAPGRYLEEWLEDEDMTQAQAGARLGYSRKHVNGIVNGHAPVNEETATRLARLTGIPAASWLAYEAAYRADLARLVDEEGLAKHARSIHSSAAKYLRDIGATTATARTPGRLVSDFLAFHRFGTWDAYEQMHDERTRGDYALAALTEQRAALDATLLSTWLRAGELEEQYERGKECVYSEAALIELLPELRERTSRPDGDLLRDVAELLLTAGVVYTRVDAPASLPLYGMTRWIDKRVPVIQQTGRRRKDGFVIWTLFHEIGHVLKDPRGEIHVEYSTEKKRSSAAEKAANAFAVDTLFGPRGLDPLRDLRGESSIRAFARETGISPGVVVHQMHRRRQLDYAHGNGLCVDLGEDAAWRE